MANQSKRIVLITGGNSGIGLEMAKQMVAQGSTVIICSRSQERLDNAPEAIPGLETIRCDIAKSEEREVLRDEIFQKFNGLNMFVNNAAIVNNFQLLSRSLKTRNVFINYE